MGLMFAGAFYARGPRRRHPARWGGRSTELMEPSFLIWNGRRTRPLREGWGRQEGGGERGLSQADGLAVTISQSSIGMLRMWVLSGGRGRARLTERGELERAVLHQLDLVWRW